MWYIVCYIGMGRENTQRIPPVNPTDTVYDQVHWESNIHTDLNVKHVWLFFNTLLDVSSILLLYNYFADCLSFVCIYRGKIHSAVGHGP